jgi:hypothetical protein
LITHPFAPRCRDKGYHSKIDHVERVPRSPMRLPAIAIASSLTFIPARVPVALVGGLRIDGQGVTESG